MQPHARWPKAGMLMSSPNPSETLRRIPRCMRCAVRDRTSGSAKFAILRPSSSLRLRIVGMFGRADRTVWLDGRPHPSEYAEHTWDGFSTGTFHDGELTVTTTHMKMGVLQKVGVYASPYSVMTEHYYRHGLYLTMVTIVDDPIYLEEPFVRSQTWVLDTSQNVGPALPWESVDELGDKAGGLGTALSAWNEAHGSCGEVRYPLRGIARRCGDDLPGVPAEDTEDAR